MTSPEARYWDWLAPRYQAETRISCHDIHYGPLVPGDSVFGLIPRNLVGRHCLEAGCGGGQNAIVLARRGGHCTGVDISAGQLRHGAELAAEHGVSVDFMQGDLRELPLASTARFDLILSAYALPFCIDPEAVLLQLSRHVRPGGTLVFSTAHPLSQAERLVVDDGEEGAFVRDYFSPESDRRSDGGGGAICTPVPVSRLFTCLRRAGLDVTALLEPRPVPLRDLRDAAPYWSEAWLGRHEELARIPAVVIFAARRPRLSASEALQSSAQKL